MLARNSGDFQMTGSWMYPKDALEKIMITLDVKNLGDLQRHIDKDTDN